MNAYTDNGYESRADYLACLANEYGLSFRTVLDIASMLGQNEDFDGLVTACEDVCGRDGF